MRFFLISDNIDTRMGFRLSGVEGVVVHEPAEFREAFAAALADESIGVVLVTEKLVNLCPDEVRDAKLNKSIPLVVEIPDRHGTFKPGEAIGAYIRDAIGIKILD